MRKYDKLDEIFGDEEFPVTQETPVDNNSVIGSPVTSAGVTQNSESFLHNSENRNIELSIQSMLETTDISEKEKLFIEVYTSSLNKAQAMREAFPELTDNMQRSYVNKLLEKSSIKKEVGQKIDLVLNSSVARAPAVLLCYTEKILDLDPLDFYWPNGTARSLETIAPELRSMISGISVVVNNKTGVQSITYDLPKKEKNLDRLSDIVALLTKTRAAMGDSEFDSGAEDAAKMRDAIFNSVDDSPNEEIETKVKRGRGRPKKDEAELKNVTGT